MTCLHLSLHVGLKGGHTGKCVRKALKDAGKRNEPWEMEAGHLRPNLAV